MDEKKYRNTFVAYNQARDLFEEHSKNSLFPRHYCFNARIRAYLSQSNLFMYSKYMNTIARINSDSGSKRILFSLDGFDYDQLTDNESVD
jgi:hypothetical protein